MNVKEFDQARFFGGMKGKVSGVWYDLISCDFEEKTIQIADANETTVPVNLIEALEKPK